MEARAGFGEVAGEPGGGAFADGQHPAFAALALANEQGAGVGIVITVIEICHFGAANAGGIEEFQNRAVAQSEGIGGVGHGKKGLNFLFAEELGEQAGLFARQVKVGSGICGDGAGAAKPNEEAPDAAEAGELGVDGEWAASARTEVAVEEKLIFLDIGSGVGGGIGCAARVRPCSKLPQRPAVGIDGGARVVAGGQGFEERGSGRGQAGSVGTLRRGCAALATSAHGGEVGESGLS